MVNNSGNLPTTNSTRLVALLDSVGNKEDLKPSLTVQGYEDTLPWSNYNVY